MFFTNHQIPCLDTLTVFRCGIEECPSSYTSPCVTRMIKGRKIRLMGYVGNHGRKGKYTEVLCGEIAGTESS